MTNTNEETRPELSSPYGPPTRHVTTHAPDGKAVFSTTLSPTVQAFGLPNTLAYDAFKTLSQPYNMSDEADIAAYQAHPPTYFPAVGETLVRYCDWAPGAEIPMHCSETIDFGVMLFGEMEAELDSGEKRVLRPGDLIVQRGTMHAWRNLSDTVWARAVYFLVGAEKVRVKGEELGWGCRYCLVSTRASFVCPSS